MSQAETPGPPSIETDNFTFDKRVKKPTLKSIFKQPITIAATVLALGVVGLVMYLERGDMTNLPEPDVTYTLLPTNQGLTDGVPVTIKLNKIALFVVDDPMEGGAGASRAKDTVEKLKRVVEVLKENPGKVITLDESYNRMAIVQQNHDGTERQLIIRLSKGDLTLAGETDEKRLARVWAERLTDSLKVIAFGEAPEFSTGTEFGDAIEALYELARQRYGTISQDALDGALELLTDPQRLALETVPPRATTNVAASGQNL